MRLHRRECGLESRYRPDLILQDAKGRFATVEVEAAFPDGNDTGMWQAVVYKHVFAAELGVPCDQVRGFLVAPQIPQSIKNKDVPSFLWTRFRPREYFQPHLARLI
jgi:hypothetical protein